MRKYGSYAVEIIHLNGNRQIREATENNSYKDTINLYHNVKEDYMNREVTINFVGLTDEGEQGIIFSKKNTLIEDEKRNIGDLMDTILEATRELQRQFDGVNDKMSYYDKKKSNIDHLMVEAADIDELTDEDIIKIFHDTRETNLMRRDYKILNKIRLDTQEHIRCVLGNTVKMIGKYENHIDTNSQKLKDLINRDEDYSGVHLTKEIPYRDIKEKKTIMKMIENKYDKIIQFPERNVIACYNKCS